MQGSDYNDLPLSPHWIRMQMELGDDRGKIGGRYPWNNATRVDFNRRIRRRLMGEMGHFVL